MLLADFTTPSNSAVGAWIAIYACVIVAVYYTMAVLGKITGRSGKTEISPQPFSVRNDPGMASKDEVEKIDTALHGRIKRERLEIDADIRRVEQIAEKRADKLEAKLDENTKLTAEMNGELNQMNQNITTLNATVTNFMRDAARHKS